MPIPPFPLEIIAEIVSHLRTPVEQPVNDSISNGQSISLVCRRFAPFGQALRWRLVRIDPSSIRSLAQHFKEFPRLAKLVRFLLIRKHQDKTGDTEEEEEDHQEDQDDEEEDEIAFQAESALDLVSVLTSTTSLLRLEIKAGLQGSSSSALTTVIRAVSALQRLNTFELRVRGKIEWNLEIAKAFDAGFPAMDILWLELAEVSVPEAVFDQFPLSNPLKKFGSFHLSIGGDPVAASSLGNYLLKQLDPSTLLDCVLGGHLANDANFKVLVACPRLYRLKLKMDPRDAANSFSNFVKHLPQFPSLQAVEVSVHGPSPGEFLAIDADIPLTTVLAALPTSLQAAGFHINFRDYESILPRHVQGPKQVAVVAIRPSDEFRYEAMLLWKAEEEEGKSASWYRDSKPGRDI
ncbi:uncharacterized protein JCM6883_004025 [Sporobolomyces salmoneus]|uniref:uncharacterized protein n=1 Tax=Sporobolomyces salmoneus TaxID=183962 RepID=UPI0031821710